MDEVIDQSTFSQDQEQFLAPPEILAKKIQSPENKKVPLGKKALLITGIVFGLILVSGIVYRTFFFALPEPQVVVVASPTPIPTEKTELQKQLQAMEEAVDAANPHTYSFPPPPVDMNVTF